MGERMVAIIQAKELPKVDDNPIKQILFDNPQNYFMKGAYTPVNKLPGDTSKKPLKGIAVLSGIHKAKGYQMPHGIQYDSRIWTEAEAIRFWKDNVQRLKWFK
jgi:hypothetical protein